MDRLQFRIAGLTRRRVRRFQQLTRPPASQPFPLTTIGLAAKGLILAPLIVVAASGLLEPTPVQVAPGLPIRAREVVVLLDGSGSMGAFVLQTQAALNRLRATGRWDGNSVGIGGSASGILEAITNALANRPSADAVWIVSDFHDGTDLVTGEDTRRYDQLVRLLLDRRVRLYLSTVSREPPPDQIQAALRSHGNWHKFEQPSP